MLWDLSLFQRPSSFALAALFVKQARGKIDVVDAGDDGEGKDGGIDGGQVIAATRGKNQGDEDGYDSQNLNSRIDFTEHGGAKAAKPCNNIDGNRADDDEN